MRNKANIRLAKRKNNRTIKGRKEYNYVYPIYIYNILRCSIFIPKPHFSLIDTIIVKDSKLFKYIYKSDES